MQAHLTKQNRYRARLREQGLRPLQIWVPDTRRPGFAEELVKKRFGITAGRAALLHLKDDFEGGIIADPAAYLTYPNFKPWGVGR